MLCFSTSNAKLLTIIAAFKELNNRLNTKPLLSPYFLRTVEKLDFAACIFKEHTNLVLTRLMHVNKNAVYVR